MTEKIKPCPFCGAHLPQMWSLTPDGTRHTIRCTECPGRAEFSSSTQQQAIAAWNRRASQPAPEGWISVETRLPTNFEQVLITDGIEVNSGDCQDGAWCVDSPWKVDISRVSHWMPFPAAPTAGKGEE